MTATTTKSTVPNVTHSVEQLRYAESQLARRRQTHCGPGETELAAIHFIIDQNAMGEAVTPTLLARHLAVSTASITSILDRLAAAELVKRLPSPTDRRSIVLVPARERMSLKGLDPLSEPIDAVVDELTPEEARTIDAFLSKVTAIVVDHCR